MAPDGGQTGEEVSTVITCEGTLGHPEFPLQFQKVVDRLNGILGVPVKVRKLEPWNSVRVTLSVPREAALRLRQLAQQGAPQLRALGILSVQLDGEGAISLRIQGANGEPQEVILRTTQDGSSSSSSSGPLGLGALLPNASGAPGSSATNSQVQFKSPNVVCPPDTVVPRVGTNMGPPQSTITSNSHNKPPYAGPFPFASMNQAIHSQSNTNSNGPSSVPRSTNMEPPQSQFLPPPYPGSRQSPNTPQSPNQPAVTISSPLLVNLLQNDHQVSTSSMSNSSTNSKVLDLPPPASPSVVRQMRPPPPPSPGVKVQGGSSPIMSIPSTTVPSPTQPQQIKSVSATLPTGSSNHIHSQANVLVNSSNNNSNINISSNSSVSPPSALTTSVASSSNSSPLLATNSSVVTSTQLAINSIANSLASAANNITTNNSQGIFGLQKGVFGQPQTSLHYQRTPQGSIIAVNKPLPPNNQTMNVPVQNSIPLHQNQRLNLSLAPVLRQQQQQIGNIPPKTGPVFSQQVVTHHNNLLHHNHSQAKIQQNVLVGGSMLSNSAAVSGNMLPLNRGRPQTPLGNMNVGIMTSNQHSNTGLGLSQDTLSTQVAQQASVTTIKKPLPSPPPYNVAISRNWDSLMGNHTNLLDLAPSLTDLKPDELDELLPTLDALPELSELELLGSALSGSSDVPSSLCEDNSNSNAVAVECLNENSTNSGDGRKFLINPLTGELEPHSGEEESDNEEVKDVFTGLPSPLGLSDDDTNSTTRNDTNTDQSDSETRSSTEGKHSRVKNSKIRRESKELSGKPEKIKLRLKLEKNEPINSAYKVDVSFINTQQPKKASTSLIAAGNAPPVGIEELRVPPLHISLRGRNSAVIKNKKKLNPDGTPVVKKARKLQNKIKKESLSEEEELGEMSEHKKPKKFKANHEHKDLLAALGDHPASPTNNTISKYSLHNHYKEKQKERRGSDSELVRVNSKKHDVNGALAADEKRRRLSQSEGDKRLDDDIVPSVLGSTNVGTVGVLPQKIRKEKVKLKESFKLKEGNRKLYSTSKTNLNNLSMPPSPSDKKQQQSATIALPTAIDMDMEAKFKQSLMEGVLGEKGIPRPPHRTVEVVGHVQTDGARIGSVGEKVPKSPDPNQTSVKVKEKSPEPDKCNVPNSERKSIDSLQDKQLNAVVTSGGRSPNSGSSGGQGEDSGIESMDALSEKSPNQASQSPHADILPNVVVPTSKSQVPDMLDIEAQLAKMEGLEPHHPEEISLAKNITANDITDQSESVAKSPNRTTEDVNENERIHRSDSKPCCELTCTLQDGLDKNVVNNSTGACKDDIEPLKAVISEDQQPPHSPPALRVAPALYSYPSIGKDGNSRGGSESPMLTTEDEDSNLVPLTGAQAQPQQPNNKSKSLLEQLLIEIPSEHGNAVAPSAHSPATRSSVRTRALSKLGSPELSSPVPKTAKAAPPSATAKRKRNESDSSNQSVDDTRKRPRKGSGKEASEVAKRTSQATAAKKGSKAGTVQNQQQEDSSDSDEPLIEKVRKTVPKGNAKTGKGVVGPQTTIPSQINNKTNTRRSARAGQQQEKQQQDAKQQPAQNTRSREKVVQQQLSHTAPQQQQGVHSNAEAEAALRRKTRSADMESKRKKEVK